jgi:hypothetical protein
MNRIDMRTDEKRYALEACVLAVRIGSAFIEVQGLGA